MSINIEGSFRKEKNNQPCQFPEIDRRKEKEKRKEKRKNKGTQQVYFSI